MSRPRLRASRRRKDLRKELRRQRYNLPPSYDMVSLDSVSVSHQAPSAAQLKRLQQKKAGLIKPNAKKAPVAPVVAKAVVEAERLRVARLREDFAPWKN